MSNVVSEHLLCCCSKLPDAAKTGQPQGAMVQTACVCGASFAASTCSVVGSTNSGSTMENTLPSPGTLWTSMCPACRSTSFQAMYNPDPTPGCAPVCTWAPGAR